MDSRIQKGNVSIKDLDEIVYKNAKLYYSKQGEIENTEENAPEVRLDNGVFVKFYDKNRKILFQGKDELLESVLDKWDKFHYIQTQDKTITIEVKKEGYESIKKWYSGEQETSNEKDSDFNFVLDTGSKNKVKITGKKIENQEEKYEIVFRGPIDQVLAEVDKWKKYAITLEGKMIPGVLIASINKIFWE